MTQDHETGNQEAAPSGHSCPFTRADATSQVIRRKDLLALGESFREALDPLRGLVECMKKQVAGMQRLQQWLLTLTAISMMGVVMHLLALRSTLNTSRELARTVVQLDDIERRMQSMSTAAARAAVAAEATKASTQALASAQAQAPVVELVESVKKTGQRKAPVFLRVSAPMASTSSSAVVASPAFTVSLEPAP